jgi:hypothetical protein
MPLDIDVILGDGGTEALIGANLAERLEDGSVRIRGTRGRIEWLSGLREGNKSCGKARSSTAKRDAKGRMAKSRTESEPC